MSQIIFNPILLGQQILALCQYVQDKPFLLRKVQDVAVLLKEVTKSLRDRESEK